MLETFHKAYDSALISDDHVNNLKDSPTKAIPEWTIDIDHGPWNHGPGNGIRTKCGPQGQWFGFTGGSGVGTVSTKLQKSDYCGKIDFGNCWDAGVVKVYFDDKLIGEAQPNTPNKVVKFPIVKDGELKIRDEGANSVIKFTKFELVECTSKVPESKCFSFFLVLSSNLDSKNLHAAIISTGLGSVRLGENQIAEVLFDDQWVPICGHAFWDNDVGYNLFCQEKGFKSGKKTHRVPLNADGLRIGTCNAGDTFLNCNSAKNNKMVVGDDEWQCKKGKDAGLVIDCKGESCIAINCSTKFSSGTFTNVQIG